MCQRQKTQTYEQAITHPLYLPLLALGTAVEIMEPAELRTKIAELARQVMEHYQF